MSIFDCFYSYKNVPAHEIEVVALATWNRNLETLVAKFLIDNPDIKPQNCELVMTNKMDGVVVTIQVKE